MQKNDYLWKGVLEDIFDDFLRFMHSDADAIFDFKRGITFLDKELSRLFPPEKEETSVKIVDKLAKLYTRDGKEEWVLIHCEVQDEYHVDFPRRMFTYFYRIFDKYGKRISAYAILTEKTPKARINKYQTEFLGTKLEYQYNVYKISHAETSHAVSLQSNNPFAMVVLTVWSVLKNRRMDDASRMEIKLKLARQFLTMSIPKEKIRVIMNFLKSYIHFENEKNNIIFDNHLKQITGRTETMGIEELILTEREKRGMERGMKRGMERGKKEGRIEGKKEGRIEGKIEIITNMLRKNLADEMIADLAEVSLEYVREIKAGVLKNNAE